MFITINFWKTWCQLNKILNNIKFFVFAYVNVFHQIYTNNIVLLIKQIKIYSLFTSISTNHTMSNRKIYSIFNFHRLLSSFINFKTVDKTRSRFVNTAKNDALNKKFWDLKSKIFDKLFFLKKFNDKKKSVCEKTTKKSKSKKKIYKIIMKMWSTNNQIQNQTQNLKSLSSLQSQNLNKNRNENAMKNVVTIYYQRDIIKWLWITK